MGGDGACSGRAVQWVPLAPTGTQPARLLAHHSDRRPGRRLRRELRARHGRRNSCGSQDNTGTTFHCTGLRDRRRVRRRVGLRLLACRDCGDQGGAAHRDHPRQHPTERQAELHRRAIEGISVQAHEALPGRPVREARHDRVARDDVAGLPEPAGHGIRRVQSARRVVPAGAAQACHRLQVSSADRFHCRPRQPSRRLLQQRLLLRARHESAGSVRQGPHRALRRVRALRQAVPVP